MILIFEKAIEKTRHKPIIPKFRISKFTVKAYIPILICFALLWIPAIIGYKNTEVYYNLDSTLPDYLPSIQANKKLDELFHTSTTHIILADASLDGKTIRKMTDEIKKVDGVKSVIGESTVVGGSIPEYMIPEDLMADVKNENGSSSLYHLNIK